MSNARARAAYSTASFDTEREPPRESRRNSNCYKQSGLLHGDKAVGTLSYVHMRARGFKTHGGRFSESEVQPGKS